MTAANLATIDEAIARAREITARRLAHQVKPKGWYRRLAAGKLTPRREWVPRDQRDPVHTWQRDERDARRARMADTPRAVVWSNDVQAYHDALYARAETRAQAEVRYACIRELMAAKLERVADWAREHESPSTPRDFLTMAEQLRHARRVGYWGVNTETAEVVVRFRDRSGLTILDPSEARERQAELVRRLVPELTRLHEAGYRLYYAVASEPNVGAGSLAWGKRHLFERFRRVILGRLEDGRAARDGGAFPEIVGAFAVQEDPLAADEQSWNVHLNLVLVVDPRQATPLAPELLEQLELGLRGQVEKFPERPRVDPTPRGCLSYAKLHFAWGSDQFYVQPLEARDATKLGKSLLEVVKYAAKWVSNKQLDELAARADSPRGAELADACAPSKASPFTLDGGRHRGRGRPAAPGVTEWPEARVAEWIEAARRFRRVRGWGLLFRLAADDPPPDPDAAGKIRWLGRVFVSPRGVVVHAAELAFVSSAHGDKSGRDFSAATGRSPSALARAGPGDLALAS